MKDWPSHRFSLLTLFVILTLLSQSILGQVRGSWEGVKTIPPGDELEVSLRNGQTMRGRLISTSDTALTLTHEKKPTDISSGDVRRVYRFISKSTKRSTLIGLGIGAAAGGVTGGVAVSRGPGEPNESGRGVLIGGTIGIAAGSLVGFIIGSRKQRVLIFETS
jgi:hypothetical protein